MFKLVSKNLLLLIFIAVAVSSCHAPEPLSEEKTSREARSLLGSAKDFDTSLLKSIDEVRILKDWSYQRETSWKLWDDLNLKVAGGHDISFLKWQTWYSREDLQRIFRSAYASLSKEERLQRSSFTEEQIAAAINNHDVAQFTAPEWNLATFDRWFARFDSDEKKASIPGINKVVMNEEALLFFLMHYREIDSCAKSPADCSKIDFTPGSAFLKLSWRRGQGDFTIPYYQSSDLLKQFEAEEWFSEKQGIPLDGESFRMTTATNQVFHLTAVHLSLRLQSDWLWTSLWLDPETDSKTDPSRGTASRLSPVWDRYKLCSVRDFAPIAAVQARGGTPFADRDEAVKAEAAIDASWCSNPYLEGGPQNQKTNCLGCHQHAGRAGWDEDAFLDQLQNNLPILTRDAHVQSISDRVWSLYNGPEPFASLVSQEIDYFDVYDLYP